MALFEIVEALVDAALAFLAKLAASLAAATALAFAVFNEADDLDLRLLYALMAAYAFLADFAAYLASFLA